MMNTRAIFCFTLALLVSGAHLATITITNKCPYTIWPGTLTSHGGPQLSSTGFELTTQATWPLNVPPPWSGRFWARTQCSSNTTGNFTCVTANCGSGQLACNGSGPASPATIVEFTIAANNGIDFYDISLVEGYNLAVSVAPQGGLGNNCTAASCTGDVIAVCPAELQVRGFDGSVIACKSACAAFNQPQYCCTGGAYNTTQTCPPTTYSAIFSNLCPDAYSYAHYNRTSRFACTGVVTYDITFCA